ncbi:hypothetical protein B0H21DRAFT_17436 [Amylocystis lapponica]|nr:hypothetical protein B0H21DRAFT_17436 [Amylocystis lapponica]
MSVMSSSDINKGMVQSAQPDEKPDKISLVELKNGKLVFKQKALSFEKMSETMQEIVKFREMIEERMERKASPLSAVPDEHRPLVAKLVHESDKTLQALSKHVQKELLPIQDEDDDGSNTATSALEVEAVEKAIKSVANRNDYGLDPVGEGKVPAALHIWRWEVKDEFKEWLPKAAREKAEARWAERTQAKKDLKALFESLLPEERSALLGSKGAAKASQRTKSSHKTAEDKSAPEADNSETNPSSQPAKKKQTKNAQENRDGEDVAAGEGSPPKGSGRPKKPVDPERAAKEKDKQEKKAAKAEKEKREKEAQEKSRSIMASFFGKSKAPAMRRSASVTNDSSVAGPSTVQSDFEKTFKPFAVKKDAILAPINWFHHVKKHNHVEHRKGGVEVIVLDVEDEVDQEPPGDVEMLDAQNDVDLGQQTAEERLQNSLASLPLVLNPRRRRRLPASHLKSYARHSVRSIMAQLNEAEIAGDDTQVRALLVVLRNRVLLPAKVLVFAEDARPGYFGTWTRSSREIGPRAPFARDLVALDYACDSGAEWEDESGDADDVVDDAEDDADAVDSDDSDADSWLVDDDDADPGTPIEEREGSPSVLDPLDVPLPAPAPKRKAGTGTDATKGSKKRKVVVPLVPFAKGPCWETRIGRCEYEPFKAYRIQLFNDTPHPIDPFTFVSAPVDERTSSTGDSTAPAARFVVPALPAHLNPASASDPPASARKRAAPPPKTTFPEAHVPLLLTTIRQLATGNLTYIVESVYRELQGERVKKNAIEAKVRELGEKCKERKIWIVRSSVQT